MSRPEVEVQKKNYTDLLDRQKLITEDNHSSANKKKSNTRHNLFCTTCLENKIFFPYLVLGFISNLNKNRALRHYPSSGNPQFQDNNWIIHWTLHVLFIY